MDTLDYPGYPGLVALCHETLRYAVQPAAPDRHNGPTLAYSYLRFSDPRQADGDSVRRQTAYRESWLARHPETRLDTTLRMADRGVSGFTGEHRTNPKHALAQFLDQVERGRVPLGSYLIVENLDRLTREHPITSIPAVLNLIAAGIRIVQLTPVEIVYDSNMEQHHLMNMLWELARGHGESKRKSGLCGAVWADKKAAARTHGTPHQGNVPAWLELAEGRYRLQAGAAATIRRIYQLATQGHGLLAITRRLNEEGVPTFARGGRWARSYVQKILAGREVLGEYQPHRGHKKRTPDGEPIPGYFPAVVSEAQWHAAQRAKDARHRRTGRPPERALALFAGLWRDALDDCPLHSVRRGARGRGRYVVSASAAKGLPGASWRPFPLEVLEDALLERLEELKAAELFTDPGASKLADLEGQLGEVERRLTVALARFEADPESAAWQAQVTRYDRQKRALVQERALAQQEAHNPLSASWSEAVGLMARQEPVRLRAALLTTIDSIGCVVVHNGPYRLCAAQISFVGGASREYLVLYRPAAAPPGARRLEQVAGVIDLAVAVPGQHCDLRRPAAARKLAARLRLFNAETVVDDLQALDTKKSRSRHGRRS